MKKLIYLFAFVAFLGGCREDTIDLQTYGRLVGEVLDAETLVPIAGVSITTNPESDLVITDEFGEFVIDSLLEGSYSVRGRATGYDDGALSIQVEGDRTNSIKLLLSKSTEDNSPPSLPSVIQPAAGAQGLSPNLTLSWSSADSDGDPLLYDVYLFTSDTSSAIPLAMETPDTFLQVENLGFGRQYFWQVVVDDGVKPAVFGEVWSFSIQEYPKDEYRYAFVRPAGSNLALFGGREPISENDEELSFQLTNANRSYWRPRLRPVLRDQMAALRLVDNEPHIFVMERDGSQAQRVTNAVPVRSKDENIASYCWSPTGDQLLYMNFGQLYRINKDGSGLRLVAEAEDGYFFTGVDWTPLDNNTIVATAERPGSYHSKLYIFQMDSVPATRPETELNGMIRSPVFDPTGRRIAFSFNSANDLSADGRPLNSQIWIFNRQTGGITNYSFGKAPGTNDSQPRFTNDGAKILFVNKPSDNIGTSRVMLMDVQTNSQNQTRVLLFNDADMPDWN
ncbi:MAG: carboxypeptidase regulatory-like domain-containing protein [Phaeodactylibacter sp.]|nr:carboxypeptidase regulatory-like domain-containing protein [Phaeodactylibacter sp.]